VYTISELMGSMVAGEEGSQVCRFDLKKKFIGSAVGILGFDGFLCRFDRVLCGYWVIGSGVAGVSYVFDWDSTDHQREVERGLLE
jgi:hypothetical protein